MSRGKRQSLGIYTAQTTPNKVLAIMYEGPWQIGTFFAQSETSVSYILAHCSRSASYIWEDRKAIPITVGEEWTTAKISIEEVRLPRCTSPGFPPPTHS